MQKIAQSVSGELKFNPEDLKLLRITKVIAVEEISATEIKLLASEISNEPVVHAWKHILSDSSEITTDIIFRFENLRRKTRVFYYYGIRKSEERELLAVACVAEKMNSESSLTGFPVIGHSYIRKAFRNFRVFFPLLDHRIAYCQKHFVDLRGILLCSQNPRIFNSICQGSFGFPFRYLGQENSPMRDGLNRMRHFIMLSPEFERKLNDFATESRELGANFVELAEMVEAFLANKYTNASYGKLKALISRLEGYPNWKKLDLSNFIELLATMDGIPILEDPLAKEKVVVGKLTTERAS